MYFFDCNIVLAIFSFNRIIASCIRGIWVMNVSIGKVSGVV